MNPPLIIGLPRSRTAWLSVFMSQSSTYFHHEALNGCCSIDEYNSKVMGYGDSTTGFSLLLDGIKGKNVVVIKKNATELKLCSQWCDVEYSIDSSEHIKKENEILKSVDGLVIKQSEIDKKLKEIWCHLVDDEWDDKYKNLTNMNIQVSDTSIDSATAKALYESIQ